VYEHDEKLDTALDAALTTTAMTTMTTMTLTTIPATDNPIEA